MSGGLLMLPISTSCHVFSPAGSCGHLPSGPKGCGLSHVYAPPRHRGYSCICTHKCIKCLTLFKALWYKDCKTSLCHGGSNQTVTTSYTPSVCVPARVCVCVCRSEQLDKWAHQYPVPPPPVPMETGSSCLRRHSPI